MLKTSVHSLYTVSASFVLNNYFIVISTLRLNSTLSIFFWNFLGYRTQ